MRRLRLLVALVIVGVVAVAPAGGAPEQAPRRGGTVVVAWPVPFEPGCVIGRVGCPRGMTDVEELTLALRPPLELTPSGFQSGLASVTLSRNPFAATIRFRPDARWSDGRPVTAHDWLFTFRLALRAEIWPDINQLKPEIVRSVAVDSRTARVVFRSSVSSARLSLGTVMPFPRHVLRGQDLTKIWREAIDNPRTGRPIATGPFLIQRWDKGERLVLVRNPNYSGAHPAYLNRLVFRFGLEDAAEALRTGEVDVVGGIGNASQIAAREFVDRPAPGIDVLAAPSNSWEHLEFNLGPSGHPALDNKLVRRALAYGIDRAAIVRAVYPKIPNLGVLDSTAFLRNERGYKPNWSRYRYRVAEARRLLAEAGCRRGADGVFACAGQRLRLRFVTLAGVPHRQRTLELIQSQLAAVGVEVVPLYAANFGFITRGDFDAALFAWTTFAGTGGHTIFTCGNRLNFTGYCSRLFTQDIDQLGRVMQVSRHAAIANRADRRLAQDVPVLPLYQPPRFVAFRESVKGIRPSAFGSPTWNAQDWWLETAP